jgi:hypothetical protein
MRRRANEGPSPDAYSKVTDPERFRPLHEAANRLLGQLEQEYVVARQESDPLAEPLGRIEVSQIVELVPASAASAPLLVAYTAFPGLVLRFGHASTALFPACGCDACNESAEQEASRLEQVVGGVVEGRFREVIRRAWGGGIAVRWELGSGDARSAGGGLCPWPARLPLWRLRRTSRWQPWPRRSSET